MFSKEQLKANHKYLYRGFLLFIFFTFLYFGYLLVSSKQSESFNDYNYREWSKGWVLVGNDGNELGSVSLPYQADANPDQIVRIKNRLPENLYRENCLQIRSSQEEITVYINGEIRRVYNDKIYRPFGKSSASATLLVPIRVYDSGKVILIEAKSGLKGYAGIMNSVHLGSEGGLLFHIIDEFFFSYILSCMILIVGIGCIIIYVIQRLTGESQRGLLYIGMLAVVLAAWLLCESDMRQFYVDSVVSVNIMAYLMIILCPIPLILYVNHLEKNRYIFSYNLLMAACLLNFIISLMLQLSNLVDLNEMLNVSFVIIFATLLVITFNFILDIRRGYGKELLVTIIGFGGLAVSVIAEISYLTVNKAASLGRFLSMGILFMILSIGISLVINQMNENKLRQEAMMESAAKTKFLATMSHEIRTPINAVLGMNEMILRESGEKRVVNYAQNISHAGQMLLSIINDILDFSKIEAGKMQIVEVNYDLNSLLNDVSQMTAVRVQEKKLDFHIVLDETMPVGYYGDEIRMKQILTNILTNAVKYTAQGEITLTVKGLRVDNEYEQLSFSVKDTGMGIKEEDMEHLFESFQRLDEVKNRGKEGTGLGLAITNGILQAMNSRLQVESKYGEGSDFHFDLMQKIVDDSPIGGLKSVLIEQEAASEHKHRSFTARRARVLIVDDNRMNLEVMKALLECTKMKIEAVESGEQCLNYTEKESYDIIFMDHMMPGMDGIETLHKLKQKKVVIALTANAISGAKEMYMKEGFDDYLTKPVLYDKLEKMILKYLPEELLDTEEDNLVDFEKGASYCGGDSNTYLDVLDIFCKETRKAFEIMQKALTENDIRLYQVKIHSVKSTALTVGAEKLSEAAKRLEAFAKADEVDSILAEHADCEKMAGKVVEQCEEFLQESNRSSNLTQEAASGLEERLFKVQNAVNDFDFGEAQKALDDVFQYIQEQ